MTTTGEYLLSKSTLPIGTALAHFLTMQTGGGTGQGTVFASMFAVRCDEPRLTLVQRAKRGAGEPAALRWPRQVDARDDTGLFVLTSDGAMSVLTALDELTVRKSDESSVFVRELDDESFTVRDAAVIDIGG